MPSLVFDPSDDFRNDGWTIVGGGGSLWGSLLSTSSDSLYISAPAGKGRATITFPLDLDAIPAGAIITSVTINVRCGKGLGTPPASKPNSVTVSVSPKDDRSKYTVRTIYPTGVATDTIVASYSRDPLGLPWDIHRLNQLECSAFSYSGDDDDDDTVRLYKFYCTVNYRTAPTVVINQPTGTVLTPTPTIDWTYSQTDGDPQAKADYKIFTSFQQAAVSFNPEIAPPVYSTTVQGAVSDVILPTSINPDSYWVYLRAYSSYGARSAWVGRQFSVDGPSPGVPGVPDPTGAAIPGTGIIQTVPDSFTGSAALTLRDTSNLASVQVGDAEAPQDGAEWSTNNAYMARDTTIAYPGGSASWKMTPWGAWTMMSATTGFHEVGGSIPITARAQFLPATTGRSSHVDLSYYDASYALISSTTGVAVTTTTGTWTDIPTTDTTPANASYVTATLYISSPANGEVHHIDHVGIMYGTGMPWSDGGHMSRNLLSSWYSNAEGSAAFGEAWAPATATTVGTAAPPGVGGSGSSCNTMTYVGLSPSLGLRAAGTAYTSPTSGNNFTLNKPTGTAAGDLMIAYVTSSEATATMNPPAGWALVDTAAANQGGNDSVMYILKRSAGASEPSSWTDGTLSTNALRRTAAVVAYTGAADASLQFLGEAAASTVNPSTYLTTPSIYNSDPNAWRVSAFVVDDASSAGTLTANTAPPSGAIPPIAFVAPAVPWTDTTGGTSYTINCPTGVQSGDLLIANVSCEATGSITAPSGWRITDTITGSAPLITSIMVRTAGASEPSSWTGTVGGTVYRPKVTECVAYRNCANASSQFLASGISENENSGGLRHTPSVTNTNAKAWRVTSWAAASDDYYAWSTGDYVQRVLANALYSSSSITSSMADSNGPVGTGSYIEAAQLYDPSDGSGASYYSATAWMGFILPLSTPPSAPGNETSRVATSVGSSNPWNVVNIFDSNGVVATGNMSISAAYTQTFSSAAGWIGLIKPATPVRAGQVGAIMATTVDISSIDPQVISMAGGFIAVTGSFIGSTAGTPYLTVNFYRANQLLNSLTQQGRSFGTGTWQKSSAVFPMPDMTTRMSVQVSVTDRNVSDVVYFDRMGLALGSDTTWRPGTYRAAHPVWSVPQIQYAEDDGTGYGDWTSIPGSLASPPTYDPLTGITTYEDHTVVPLTNRKYRARTLSYGLAGDQFVSPWGPESDEFSFTAENWWLKDISDPTNNLLLKVKWDTFSLATQNTATQYQPTGTDFPIVLTEGFKSDLFVVDLIPVNQLDYAQLKSMLRSGKTLFLQSDVDNAWWVKSVADITSDLLPSNQRKSNPQREIKVTFVQVAPPS